MNTLAWKLRTQTLLLDKPVFMGIVNITPDSFSDGGKFFDPDKAVEHALQLINDGVGIIDIGGESTRPGSAAVDTDEELRRVIPTLTKIVSTFKTGKTIPISVDTRNAVVAREAVQAGAEIINDVSAGPSPAMLDVLLDTGAGYVLMHSRGTPETMQFNPQYKDVVEEVFNFLRCRRSEMITAGVEAERIAVDPGLGFGKTTEHNLQLIEHIDRFNALDAPVLVGHSRKRFVAQTYQDRNEGTRMITGQLIKKGVQIIRLHEIKT
jgi:dihydropteroate synthase